MKKMQKKKRAKKRGGEADFTRRGQSRDDARKRRADADVVFGEEVSAEAELRGPVTSPSPPRPAFSARPPPQPSSRS